MRNGRRGRDGMEGGFMTTYGISAYAKMVYVLTNNAIPSEQFQILTGKS
jgi:hypothetical protein